MNWKTTWLLVALAAGLFVFILFVERHAPRSSGQGDRPARLFAFKAENVDSMQLRHTNQLVARVDRTNGFWIMTVPLVYPARVVAVSELLRELSLAEARATLSAQEMKDQNQTLADFGLEVPRATLTLLHEGQRTELAFGSKTSVGEGVYMQVLQKPEVHVVDTSLYETLPGQANHWRSAQVLNLQGFYWDRLEVRTAASTYALQADVTNQTFFLSQPTPARADLPKVEKLLRAIQSARVLEFVSDNPLAELDRYGLRNPRGELVFSLQTNELVRLQFGTGSTNKPGTVYLRNLTYTNIMLVSETLWEDVNTTHAQLRENRLFTLNTAAIQSVELQAATNVVLQRQPSGGWSMSGDLSGAGDPRLMRLFFELLGGVEGEVERNVATDFSAFGLAEPGLAYRFMAGGTNDNGSVTNPLLLELAFGNAAEEKVYVRRSDEPTVYSIPRSDFDRLPRAGWQLRSRRVWSFTTNDVRRIRVRVPDRTVEIVRTGPGAWELAAGSQGVINPFAVEETLHRLGQLEAEFWLDRGPENRDRFGFTDQGFRVEIMLQDPAGTRTRWVEFGPPAPDQFPLAMAEVNGEVMIFEFPKKLHFEVLRDLVLPFLKDKSQIF